MNYTPARPAYEDMRDGILQSIANLPTELDQAQAACIVWDAFAQFGIGVGANGVETPFSITESFDRAASCAAADQHAADCDHHGSRPTASSRGGTRGDLYRHGDRRAGRHAHLIAGRGWPGQRSADRHGGSFSRSFLVVGHADDCGERHRQRRADRVGAGQH